MIKIVVKGMKNIGFLAKAFEEAFNEAVKLGFSFNNDLKQVKKLKKFYKKQLNKKIEKELYGHFIRRFNKRN